LICLSDEYDENDVRGSKIKTVEIFGTTYPITSWKELYKLTCELLEKKDSLLFQQVAREQLKTRSECSAPHPLSNGYWIDVHRSSTTILNFVMELMRGFEASDEDFILQVDK
jgi:hypothetical protein